MKKVYLTVMGTMGAGKSTASRLLAKELKLKLIEENFGDNAFLPRFYAEMKRWAFHSQTFFLMEKITQMLETAVMLNSFQHLQHTREKKEIPKQVRDDAVGIIQDTPIYQDVFSYAKAQNILGHMDDAEWRLYLKIFRSFLPLLPKPTHILYIKTSIDTVKDRMKKRNRDFEKQVPEGYLELLEMLNERWLKKEADDIKVFTIETDELNIVRSEKDKQTFVELAKKELF